MTLAELLSDVPAAQATGSLDTVVSGIQYDSRAVRCGDVFVAVRGLESDGHDFIQDAISRGASAVIREQGRSMGDVVSVHVADSRKALALASARFYGCPARKLQITGVTGTNGKTTVTWLARSVLEAGGIPTGLIGTINYQIGGDTFQDMYHRTTPESLDLHRIMAQMVEKGQQAAVVEVSSHSLALDRTYGIPFSVAVFTNLSRDHLDFHKTLEGYLEAKLLLFEGLDSQSDARAVINIDDPAACRIISRTQVPVLTYGLSSEAEVRAHDVSSSAAGTCFLLVTPSGQIALDLKLRGRFNVYNALAAAAIGVSSGLDLETIRTGIERISRVDGRFEPVDCGQDFAVLVDYAHTPDALGHLLSAAKELATGRLISVFGCGGDRDPGKRPQMGRISCQIADLTIITSDNPRSESPEAIIQQIVAGLPRGARYEVQPDRRQAIQLAVGMARQGDVVVIAGKGHETYQIVGNQTFPFDDREEARLALKALG